MNVVSLQWTMRHRSVDQSLFNTPELIVTSLSYQLIALLRGINLSSSSSSSSSTSTLGTKEAEDSDEQQTTSNPSTTINATTTTANVPTTAPTDNDVLEKFLSGCGIHEAILQGLVG